MFYKSNRDLSGYKNQHREQENLTKWRNQFPIAVIDDEPFAPEVNLRAHGYNITSIGDIKSIDEVQPYSIVLCDVMGVGQHFDSNKQGASLIAEIRQQLPSTTVIAYTGSTFSSAPAKQAREMADITLRKDADISEWKEKLDKSINNASNPHWIWNRVRIRLTELEIDTKDILKLEDAYVRGIVSIRGPENKVIDALASVDINSHARGVIQSLVASSIFKMLTG